MATIKIAGEHRLTPKAFRKKLDEMHALRSPLDDLMDLMRELALYEHKYRMHSDEFFAKYSQGKLSDDKDFVLWAGEYQVFRDYKSKFEQQWGKLHAA